MPEPLIHFVVPFFILTAMGFSVKKAVLFSLLAVLPDADVLFGVHRSLSHSVVVIGLVGVLCAIILKDRVRDVVVGTAVALSHPVMDIFTPFVPIFYPIYNRSVYLVAQLTTKLDNIWDLKLKLGIYTEPSAVFAPVQSFDVPVFTGNGVALSLVLLMGVVLMKRFKQ